MQLDWKSVGAAQSSQFLKQIGWVVDTGVVVDRATRRCPGITFRAISSVEGKWTFAVATRARKTVPRCWTAPERIGKSGGSRSSK